MVTVVLMHCGFAGGWIWRAVATHLEHLRASGEDLSESLFEPTPQPPQQELY